MSFFSSERTRCAQSESVRRFRPTLEALEERACPAVLTDVGLGADGMVRIVGNAGDNRVVVNERGDHVVVATADTRTFETDFGDTAPKPPDNPKFNLGEGDVVARFRDGVVGTRGIPENYHFGAFVFITGDGATSKVTFKTPADRVHFFIKEVGDSQAAVRFFNADNRLLKEIDVENDPAGIKQYREIEVTADSDAERIKRIEITSIGGVTPIDDFTFQVGDKGFSTSFESDNFRFKLGRSPLRTTFGDGNTDPNDGNYSFVGTRKNPNGYHTDPMVLITPSSDPSVETLGFRGAGRSTVNFETPADRVTLWAKELALFSDVTGTVTLKGTRGNATVDVVNDPADPNGRDFMFIDSADFKIGRITEVVLEVTGGGLLNVDDVSVTATARQRFAFAKADVSGIDGALKAGNDVFVNNTHVSAVVNGGADNDRLFGGNSADVLRGGSGNDLLRGRGGNDSLFGNAGADNLGGGAGNDFLSGGGDNDVLRGNEGDDVLQGNGGDDRLLGGAGADNLMGGAGDDLLDGGNDGDVDVLFGGAGADVFIRYVCDPDLFADFDEDEGDVIRNRG